MLVTPATSRRRSAPPRVVDDTSTLPPSPPVITPAAKHPVYGATPIGRDGFTLERQNISMLNFWHKRAARLGEPENAEAYSMRKIRSEIFEAALKYKPRGGREIADQFAVIAREMEIAQTVTVLGVDEFVALSSRITDATAMRAAPKEPGALSRGRKLTRAGLLRRYQSFLLGELETVSWHLYGSRDYAMQVCPTDDAVNKRLRHGRGHNDPFFEEKTLPARARSVLKALKINAEHKAVR